MSPYQEPDHLAACTLLELLLGGDWACGENHGGALAEVARHLAPRVRLAEREALYEVARLAARDMEAASAVWLACTTAVRGRCRRGGRRHDDPAEDPERQRGSDETRRAAAAS